MLKEGEGRFIDDLTVVGLEAELDRPVMVVPATPAGFYEALRRLAAR
jgi:hypothetical protein